MNASRTSCFSIELAKIRISNALTSVQHCFKLRSAGGYQGNRISDLGEELCEVSVLPTGPFDFDTQGTLGGFLGQEIKGHMAQDGEVMWAVIAAVSGIVLIHNDVQDPMQVVFDRPMGPRCVPE